MTNVAEYAALVDQRTALRQEQRREHDTLHSVHRRIAELEGQGGKEADLFKANDKLRHTLGRLTELDLKLIGLDGEIEKHRFEADFS